MARMSMLCAVTAQLNFDRAPVNVPCVQSARFSVLERGASLAALSQDDKAKNPGHRLEQV